MDWFYGKQKMTGTKRKKGKEGRRPVYKDLGAGMTCDLKLAQQTLAYDLERLQPPNPSNTSGSVSGKHTGRTKYP